MCPVPVLGRLLFQQFSRGMSASRERRFKPFRHQRERSTRDHVKPTNVRFIDSFEHRDCVCFRSSRFRELGQSFDGEH